MSAMLLSPKDGYGRDGLPILRADILNRGSDLRGPAEKRGRHDSITTDRL